MARRLLFVLCVLAALTALALVSGAAGSTAGSKFKIKVAGEAAVLPGLDPDSIVVTMVGDKRTCAPFLDPNGTCNFWTARAGAKVVLKSTADPPYGFHFWLGDCTGSGDCKLTMDSNKSVVIVWTLPT
jgi:hypothetical protein